MHPARRATSGFTRDFAGGNVTFPRLTTAVCCLLLAFPASVLGQPASSGAEPPEAAASQTASSEIPEIETTQTDDPLADLLRAGRAALDAGRVDLPEQHSARHYFERARQLDPWNAQVRQGLLAVQQRLIERALALAESGDFDAAEQMLGEAAEVVQSPQDLDAAQARIDDIRNRHAADIESRAFRALEQADFHTAEGALIDLVALGQQDVRVAQLRRRIEDARTYGGFAPGLVIRDPFLNAGTWAPESVVILAGSFSMGSPGNEKGRTESEGPVHRVTFQRGFAIGQREVTVGEFRAFIDHSGHVTDAERAKGSTVYDELSGRLAEKRGINWRMDFEGKPAEPDEPVVHVSWNDAQAYAEWLARGTGKPYRLPSEAEFEYALRAGTTTRYWWGNGSPSRIVENLTGSGDKSRTERHWSMAFKDYTDRFWGPAPVASFEPNPFGLYDMGGNVGEWVADCWHDTYIRAPADGSAWVNPGCSQRVVRGGFWASSPDQSRSAFRRFAKADFHDARIGFRIARDL